MLLEGIICVLILNSYTVDVIFVVKTQKQEIHVDKIINVLIIGVKTSLNA